MTDIDPTPPGKERSDRERRDRIAEEAKSEASAMFREGMAHPATKPVLKGAAVGALAGMVLPVIGPIIGAAAGGGYMFYKRLNSTKD